MAGLAVKGESRAVGMRAATIEGACGVAEFAVKAPVGYSGQWY